MAGAPRAGPPPAACGRTDAGNERTPAGATRTPDGLGAGTASGRKDDATRGQRLGGEITSATEPAAEPDEGTKLDQLVRWITGNWKLWAPLLALGLVVAGAGAFPLRGDPVKAARRNAAKAGRGGARGAAGKAAEAGAEGRRMRMRGGRKKDDDEEEDEEPPAAPKGRRRR